MAHHRSQRLLGDALGQDHLLAFVRELPRAHAGKTRGVRRVRVAAARSVGLQQLVELVDQHRLEGHLVLAEIVREVELGGRAGLHADRGAVQLPGALDAALGRHHEALAVVEVHARAIEAQLSVAQQGLRRVTGDDVDLPRLEGDEALLRGGRREFHFLRVAEHGDRDRLAEIDVEAGPLALAVGEGEARQAGVDRALHEALGLHGIEGLAGPCR